jgi:hypothetical protein
MYWVPIVASGREVVKIVIAPAVTVMVKEVVAIKGVGVVESETVTLNTQFVMGVVGVPENTPVVLFRSRPMGGQLADGFDVDQLL